MPHFCTSSSVTALHADPESATNCSCFCLLCISVDSLIVQDYIVSVKDKRLSAFSASTGTAAGDMDSARAEVLDFFEARGTEVLNLAEDQVRNTFSGAGGICGSPAFLQKGPLLQLPALIGACLHVYECQLKSG